MPQRYPTGRRFGIRPTSKSLCGSTTYSLRCAHWMMTRHPRRGIERASTVETVPGARYSDRLMRSLSQRWRERGGRTVRLALPFDDIMEIALAVLALSPAELEALGWTFADRKRLLDHFLVSGKAAQRQESAALGQARLELRLPLRDVRRLRTFVHRELPKAASNAAVFDRLGAILDAVL
jgi:hypothetical protein